MTKDNQIELLARYVEGNVTADERTKVRHYLATHPDEMDSVLCMMDEDYDLQSETGETTPRLDLPLKEAPETSICYSAAAFVPIGLFSDVDNHNTNEVSPKNQKTLADRMDNLLDEL